MVNPEFSHLYHSGVAWVQSHPPAGTLLSGLSLSTLVTLGLDYVKRKADKLERTFKLHNEFSSFEFIKTRAQAYTLLARNRTMTFQELAVNERFEEPLVYLTRLIVFYEHLSISIRSGFIDKTAGCRYFGMVFLWWYVNYFNAPRGLPSTQWEAAKDIHALFAYFKKHARRKDFDVWMNNATGGSTFERFLIAQEKLAEEEKAKKTCDEQSQGVTAGITGHPSRNCE